MRLSVFQTIPILSLAACAAKGTDFFAITSLITPDMEKPRHAQDGLTSISIDEQEIYILTSFVDLIPRR